MSGSVWAFKFRCQNLQAFGTLGRTVVDGGVQALESQALGFGVGGLGFRVLLGFRV